MEGACLLPCLPHTQQWVLLWVVRGLNVPGYTFGHKVQKWVLQEQGHC